MPSYAVIGGSRGIGLELVRQLAMSADNTVFATVRNKSSSTYLNELVAKSTLSNIHVLEAEVTDHRTLKAAAAAVAKVTNGSLDVLIHNAARMELANAYRGLTDYEDDDKLDTEFLDSFKVNVLGAIHAVNAFLPLLRKGSAKKIAVIGSEGGTPEFVWKLRLSNMAAYGTTKAAENLVAVKYAALLEPEGFTVVGICPGFVDTSSTAVEKPDDTIMSILGGLVARLPAISTNFTLISTEASVTRILSLVDSISTKDNGSFIEYVEYKKDD
ncbi:NAD(P)-binding protein [Daedalea quercina L-15889]|uniref:NAD(P)-binding protein n=1 Tax=Daedalea quercina L-15889 TaxID=1314783 RepID=A0A165RZX1_9APHY|nr:NAD(P)-binding protein [Daedalea quercina L-15889]